MTTWKRPTRPLILASGSPRRAELLCTMGLRFDIQLPRGVDEEVYFDGRPFENAVTQLAVAKARSVAAQAPQALVLGGDTIVCIGERALGKPCDRAQARRMLGDLSGRVHTVISGVALVCEAAEYCAHAHCATAVSMRDLDDWEIEEYLDEQTYADKAGAYAIQQSSMTFIDSIEGCYYNVVGLPVSATIGLLQDFIKRKDVTNV